MDGRLLRAARVALENCMAVSKREVLLVVVDEPLRSIGYAFWSVGRQLGVESIITEFITQETHGAEPPDAVARLMADADVVIAPTSRSLSHTRARRRACAKGARIATLPGITADSMRRTLTVDYKKIKKLSVKLATVLTRASEAHLVTPAGTDITMSLKGRKGHADTGIAHKKGDFTNLPAGEAYIAPVEGSANGIIVVDGSMSGAGLTRRHITMHVKNGHVVKFEGGKNAGIIRQLVKRAGALATNIAELGIGTNTKARVTGNTLEDEKAIGTVHMAIGDNRSMGGRVTVPLHLDAVMLKPTLKLDGKLVLKNGKLLK
ncbi:MAG: leucyl aminopeptidase [Latescibacteria bacterium DG_63]|nr:MAG: leucyl aminopeptidase [Latescibacteria bacterium DG_63]